ncbi:MAG TPA: DUF6152 family protein [Candidatus Acidoferrales bacterium]|nr:DUF6152 family protein [Candidatus Acidoferrales bacterium]
MIYQIDHMLRAANISLVFLALLMAVSAFAHHSRAMFDQDKQVTLVGTVKDFQWTNPHCWIQLLVSDPRAPEAAPVEWGVEMDSPVALLRRGWKKETLKPGDKVTVVINPLRDGQTGGLVVSVAGADGRSIGRPAAPQ